MERKDVFPFVSKFVTVYLMDGTERSGFIANPDELKDELIEHPEIRLINGLFSDMIPLDSVEHIEQTVREDTVALPIVDVTDGFEQ